MKKIYCKKCGYKIFDSDTEYCPRCGSRVNDFYEVQKIEKDKKTRNILLIALAIVIIASILIMTTGFIIKQDMNNNQLVSNVKFTVEDFETLGFTADLNPTKDYDYLSIEIEYYDKNNNLVDKTPIAWNQNNVKANQPVKINEPMVMSYYNKGIPAKAIVKVYDSVYSKDPIQTIEVNLNAADTNNNTNASQSSNNNNNKHIYGYADDGTPFYSQAELERYVTEKGGYASYDDYLKTQNAPDGVAYYDGQPYYTDGDRYVDGRGAGRIASSDGRGSSIVTSEV